MPLGVIQFAALVKFWQWQLEYRDVFASFSKPFLHFDVNRFFNEIDLNE